MIGDALSLNMTLEGLSLWQNEITGKGAQCLAEGLQVRPGGGSRQGGRDGGRGVRE